MFLTAEFKLRGDFAATLPGDRIIEGQHPTKLSSLIYVGILKALLVILIGDSRDDLKPQYWDFVYSRIGRKSACIVFLAL